MPGLLQTPDDMFGSARFTCAVAAELLGSMMFAFIGSASLYVATSVLTANGTIPPNVVMAAFANGLMLAVAIFATANVSGGHITPTVTIATMITGHIQIIKGICYIVAQIVGSIFASLLIAGLVPGSYIGMGNGGTGCFGGVSSDITNGMLFGWEFVLSFILVSLVYAVAIGEPSFGNIAPFAAGLSLTVDLFAGAAFSTGGVSPARVLGPAVVFHCHWNKVWVMVLGECVGAIVAGLLAVPLYGGHAMWMDKALPWGYHHYESKSMQASLEAQEAMMNGADNIGPKVPPAMAP